MSTTRPIIAIIWDFQNVSKIELAPKLINLANGLGDLRYQKVYSDWEERKQQAKKEELLNQGFECIDVAPKIENLAELRSIYDCLNLIDADPSLDTLIIVSGDGDYKVAVKTLTKLGIKVIVIARHGNCHKDLMKIADQVYLVDKNNNLEEYQNHHHRMGLSHISHTMMRSLV